MPVKESSNAVMTLMAIVILLLIFGALLPGFWKDVRQISKEVRPFEGTDFDISEKVFEDEKASIEAFNEAKKVIEAAAKSREECTASFNVKPFNTEHEILLKDNIELRDIESNIPLAISDVENLDKIEFCEGPLEIDKPVTLRYKESGLFIEKSNEGFFSNFPHIHKKDNWICFLTTSIGMKFDDNKKKLLDLTDCLTGVNENKKKTDKAIEKLSSNLRQCRDSAKASKEGYCNCKFDATMPYGNLIWIYDEGNELSIGDAPNKVSAKNLYYQNKIAEKVCLSDFNGEIVISKENCSPGEDSIIRSKEGGLWRKIVELFRGFDPPLLVSNEINALFLHHGESVAFFDVNRKIKVSEDKIFDKVEKIPLCTIERKNKIGSINKKDVESYVIARYPELYKEYPEYFPDFERFRSEGLMFKSLRSVMHTESGFNVNAVSSDNGARGLGQFRYTTWRDVIRRLLGEDIIARFGFNWNEILTREGWEKYTTLDKVEKEKYEDVIDLNMLMIAAYARSNVNILYGKIGEKKAKEPVPEVLALGIELMHNCPKTQIESQVEKGIWDTSKEGDCNGNKEPFEDLVRKANNYLKA